MPGLSGRPEVHLARLLHRLHDFLRGEERRGAEIPVPAGAGDGDRHRGGLDIVRHFAQPDKVIGTKGVVERFEFPPKALPSL